MKSRALVFVLLGLVVIAGCAGGKKAKTKRLAGTWQMSPIVIDGKNNDWPSPYPEYDDKALLGYCVSNDKYNLYITVETGDIATQLKILKNGLTVWIDKTGEKDEITGINFPIPQEFIEKETKRKTGQSSTATQSDDNGGRPSAGHWEEATGGGTRTNNREQHRMAMQEKVRSALEKAQYYSLQGFKACNLEFPLLENDTCGIKVRMTLDSENELIWEAVVPFKSFYYKKEIGKMDKGKPISVCFETTGSKRPAGQQYNGGGGSAGSGGGFSPSIGFGGFGGMGMSMGMGGGGYHGGGHHGGQQSHTDSEMESLYKSTKTYKVFGLAWVENAHMPPPPGNKKDFPEVNKL